MVSKITIFEPHFDGAQFGPAWIPGDESDGEATEPIVEDGGGRHDAPARSVFLLGGIALGLLIGLKARRGVGSDESETVTFEERPVEAASAE